MSGSLFYPPSPAMSLLDSSSDSGGHSVSAGTRNSFEAGLLNDDRLSYGPVPHSSAAPSPVAHSAALASPEPTKASPSKHPRLMSLDCFRGLTIAWMIMSDEGGNAWTHSMDHSPWDGLHFNDFVFPAFVFIVGMAVPLSTHKFADDRWGVTKKAIWRAIKMFIVGFVSASGGFPAAYRLAGVRIPGILQRIAFCYLVTVLIHVWVPVRASVDTSSRLGLLKKYAWQWLVALALTLVYLLLTFATYVPDCGYGDLGPECNATGYWDRQILGLSHMFRHPTLNRSVPCSLNSPGYFPFPGMPAWCTRPFDPEGIVGSFTAAVTGFFGLYFGHVLSDEKGHKRRITQWLSVAGVCMLAGLILHFAPLIPINKNLWSLSYVLVMVGVDGAVFAFFYYVVDVRGFQRPVWPMICMGMNAILVFVLAQSDINLDTAIQWFYLDKPNQNLYWWYQNTILLNNVGLDWSIFLWAVTKTLAWFAISVWLYRNKIFLKL